MMPKNQRLEAVLILLVTLAIAGFVGVQMVGAVQDHMESDAHQERVEWCEERGGELVNIQSVWHGGMHCDLPNDELVHFKDIEINESESV